MITLQSCVSHQRMDITELDHAPLKELLTMAARDNAKKILYKRRREIIVADVESVFDVLTQLDKIVHGGQ